MGYQRPLVMVFQEYAQMSVPTQTATLYPCIVGPCYTVIDAVEDEALALVGAYTSAGLNSVSFPNNQPGALIEDASVSLRFKSPVALITDAAIAIDAIADNVLTFTELTYPTDAQVGDLVEIADITAGTTLPTLYKITGLNAGSYAVMLNRSPEYPDTSMSFEADLYREVDEFTILGDDATVTLDTANETFSVTGVQVAVDGIDKTISSATLYVGYRALRTDLTDIGTVYGTDDAKGQLGKLDTPDNPLGLAVATTLANTTVGVKYIGVASDDIAGFTAAKDRLETYEDVYAIVPLSQTASVVNMFGLHAAQMSLPAKGAWRVAIGSLEMPTETLLQTGNGETKADGEGDLILFQDLTAQFQSNGVSAGDELRVVGVSGDETTYTIASVISEDLLSIAASTPFDPVDHAAGAPYAYTVYKILSKSQQADAVKAISNSFANSRLVHVWPDTVKIGGNTVPGYYLGCAVAGATGGLPSHHGFTRLSIAGIDELVHSGDYFNQDQLDTIAEGGTFIFLQTNPQAAPVIRHQLTTDMSTIEMSEFSFVKNFDYVSMLCKDVLDNFIGRYNITPATLGVLETAVRSVLESLKLYTLPRIGSPILGYSVVSVAQLDDIRDRVEMYVDVDFPYPLNTVGLHLVSR